MGKWASTVGTSTDSALVFSPGKGRPYNPAALSGKKRKRGASAVNLRRNFLAYTGEA